MNAILAALLVIFVAGNSQSPELPLPAQLSGKAQVLMAADPDYARAAVGNAVKPAGQGGISAALVVRVTQDIPVYRLWNGPGKQDVRTNRMGGWWSYDAPKGPVSKYRSDYEICLTWNELAWVATCTLKKDSVVAIGPGQSVSAETCKDPTGKENYPANATGWQTYVDQPWNRGPELACPPESSDYAADPADISKSR